MRSYRPKAIWKVLLADILAGALILGLVTLPVLKALIPKLFKGPAPSPAPELSAVSASPAPAQPAAETPETPAAPEAVVSGPETQTPAGTEASVSTAPEEQPPAETVPPTPEPTPDNRTEWQIRFAEHFTDEVVITDHSYTSPNVSITVETREFNGSYGKSVYHVADIYVASLDNFRTYTANNELADWSTQDAMTMDRDCHAILAISGDFYTYQSTGFLARNGVLWKSDQTRCDLCVLYNTGVMACYKASDYTVEDIWERGVAQAWNFGPSLLDENGHVLPDYQVSVAVSYPNPRSAVGYYEPGHYCFVVVDGRQDDYSKGVTVPELAQIFEELGCSVAYNLDGGGSALMTFLHERYSRQSNGAGRELGDMLIVTEEGWEEKR